MNCAEHPETAAVAFCRECGKALCGVCRCPALGSVYCATHALSTAPPAAPPVPVIHSPYTAADPVGTRQHGHSPALALILGLIVPGLGAIYNGQYAKGLIHGAVTGIILSILNSGRARGMEPLLAVFLVAWWVYMGVEAYHTARKRQDGVQVDEFSSLFDTRAPGSRFPTGAVLLIVVGFVFLLDTTNVIDFDRLARFWPLGMIALGVYLLYSRLHSTHGTDERREGEVRR